MLFRAALLVWLLPAVIPETTTELSADLQVIRHCLYPNPVSGDKLIIAITGTEFYNAEVHNLSGVRVLQKYLGKERELNVSGLASGLYVLSVKSASGEVQTSTFLVK